MKKTKRILLSALLLVTVFLLGSCAGDYGASGGSGGYGGSHDYTSGEAAGDGGGEGSAPGADSDDGEDGGATNRIPSGQMTASAWNDNDNYSFWQETLQDKYSREGNNFGKWLFQSSKRIAVTVKNGETPLAGVKLEVKDTASNSTLKAVTNSSGVAYFFDLSEGDITATVGDVTRTEQYNYETTELTIDLAAENPKLEIIDLMLVVDVTGSMGDELRYLSSELSNVVETLSAKHANATINLALLFYRDNGDSEKFSYYDFLDVTNQNNLKTQINAIKAQSATGGGDYPEAVDEALELAVSKQWSSGASTKMIFFVLDAPPHDSRAEYIRRYLNANTKAVELGIRICPIICSGADLLTEYLMRQTAITTGGTFVFITDDSGIGGAHHDPNLPNTTVEALNALMIRLVDGYYTGVFQPPVPYGESTTQT